MKQYKAMTVENIQKINELYNKGQTCKEIAKCLGYGHQTVANYVWESRGRGVRHEEAEPTYDIPEGYIEI